MKKCIALIGAVGILVGCSGVKEVKPWEKGALAKDIMQFNGLNPEVKKFEQHVYFSKEGTRGGYGVAGGGCGCN
jgi:hypothetical protein